MGRQVLTAITGATISSIIMAMVLPGSIALMAASESQHFYMRGFQTASLAICPVNCLRTTSTTITAPLRRIFSTATPSRGGNEHETTEQRR